MSNPISSSFHFGNHSKEVHFSEDHIGQDEFDIKEPRQTTIHINRSELHDAVLELKTEKYGKILGKLLTWWAFLDLRFWKNDKSREFKFLQDFGAVKIEDTEATELSDLVQKVKEVALYSVDWNQYAVDEDVIPPSPSFTTQVTQEQQDITPEQDFSLSGRPPKLTDAALKIINEEEVEKVEEEEGMGERQNAFEFFETTLPKEMPPIEANLERRFILIKDESLTIEEQNQPPKLNAKTGALILYTDKALFTPPPITTKTKTDEERAQGLKNFQEALKKALKEDIHQLTRKKWFGLRPVVPISPPLREALNKAKTGTETDPKQLRITAKRLIGTLSAEKTLREKTGDTAPKIEEAIKRLNAILEQYDKS